MSEQIDYEAEVKKTFPEAWCDKFINYCIYVNNVALWPIARSDKSEADAWQQAYTFTD